MTEDKSRTYRAFEAGARALAASLTPLAVRDDVVQRLFMENQEQFDTSRLYYEAHLTVEPLVAESFAFEDFAEHAEDLGWRASKFEHDEVDNIVGKWFITSRAESQTQMVEMVRQMRSNLEGHGFTVLRSKIEDTLLDTKHGDVL